MKRWVTRELASYAVERSFEDYPARVVEKAKLFVLDSIGCMFGGCQTGLGRAIMTPVKNMGGSEEATIVGGGLKVPTIQAAFVNGTTANALDYDDTLFGIGHPGASIIPAALAMGEWKKASGKEVINAILIGYDVADRIGKAIQPSYERLQKVWGVGTWQTFGAVVSAGKILGFDTERMLDAFGVAGATAPLPNTQKWGWDMEERPIHWVKEPTGWPAWTGATAAVLASHGFVGNRHILDGENGFWIMAGSDRCDFDGMTRGLGTEYEVDDIAIKPYSSCRWQHAALDCVRELKEQHGLKAEEVEEVTVHSFAWVKRQEIYGPAGMVDAQFSLPYTAAMVLMGQRPGPAWYTAENLESKEVLGVSRKVRVEIDPDIDRAYFEKDRIAARVTIVRRDGTGLEKYVEIPRGDPLNPLTMEEVEDKFRDQASYSLEEQEIESAIEKIQNLEDIKDISDLTACLGGH
ncbi:MAG: MmgE/PrpD family protein [Deltaproteobacteria bacterium]|nr:MmgE/PrpD family protein [Deltaproteobacteria bacterium]MBW2122247.1 MmgE/PrpD family protein [Deltaproteobacteria bacterium]